MTHGDRTTRCCIKVSREEPEQTDISLSCASAEPHPHTGERSRAQPATAFLREEPVFASSRRVPALCWVSHTNCFPNKAV